MCRPQLLVCAVSIHEFGDTQDFCRLATPRRLRSLWARHRVVYMYTNMITIRFRMVPRMPSIAKTLSSLLSFSWPPLSSSFPFVITILVANVFIFLPRPTWNGKEAAQKMIIIKHLLLSQADWVGVVISCLGTRSLVGVKNHLWIQSWDTVLLAMEEWQSMTYQFQG